MPCYRPLQGWRSRRETDNGKRRIVFNRKEGFSDRPVTVPCGQCIGCRLERSRQWAMRCYHESQLYEDNAFVTLTYDDAHLPEGSSLRFSDFQDFFKRLRHHTKPRRLRYFHCGEYGSRTLRPHYHACIFNLDVRDKKLYSERDGNRLYTSDWLESIWGHGFVTVGDVTFESAAYVARYIMKKITGDQAEAHYEIVDSDTGEVYTRAPEYVTMSRRPGIGKGWLDKYKDEVYHHDSVVIRGREMRPPKFYDDQLEEAHLLQIKGQRIRAGKAHADDNTTERLRVRETVKEAQTKFLKRTLE